MLSRARHCERSNPKRAGSAELAGRAKYMANDDAFFDRDNLDGVNRLPERPGAEDDVRLVLTAAAVAGEGVTYELLN